MRRTGDGFMQCSDGHVRWGVFGAAGVVFVVRFPDGPRVMLQKRSAMAHEGGTWSCAGGALDEGEIAARRRAPRGVGGGRRDPGADAACSVRPCSRRPPTGRYTTFVVEVPGEFGASINFETDAIAWYSPDEVEQHPLHAGFAAAWPALREIIEHATNPT